MLGMNVPRRPGNIWPTSLSTGRAATTISGSPAAEVLPDRLDDETVERLVGEAVWGVPAEMDGLSRGETIRRALIEYLTK